MRSLEVITEELASVKREKDGLEENCLKISGEIIKFAKVGFKLTQPGREHGRDSINGV